MPRARPARRALDAWRCALPGVLVGATLGPRAGVLLGESSIVLAATRKFIGAEHGCPRRSSTMGCARVAVLSPPALGMRARALDGLKTGGRLHAAVGRYQQLTTARARARDRGESGRRDIPGARALRHQRRAGTGGGAQSKAPKRKKTRRTERRASEA